MPKSYTGIKGILIARVSEEAQRKALPAQKRNLEEYADKLGLDKEYHEFDETAFKVNERSKFNKIVKDIESRSDFSVVVFDKIDRFSREGSAEEVRIIKTLIRKGQIELHFASDGLQLRKYSPAGDWARLNMGMVLSENYSDSISDGVRRKQDYKKSIGELPGKAPIGYKNIITGFDSRGDKTTDIIVDKERAPFIKRAFELKIQGLTLREIARILREDGFRTRKGRPVAPSTIEIILKNEFYAGTSHWGEVPYQHKYPPLVDKRTFDATQRALAHDSNHSGKKARNGGKEPYTYGNGILKCKGCGGAMSSYLKKGSVYIRCSKHKEECNNCGTSEKEVDEQVVEVLDRIKITEKDVMRVLGTLKKKHDCEQMYFTTKIESARTEYSRLDKKKELAYEDRLNGCITLDKYQQIAQECDMRMAELDEAVARLESEDGSFIVDAPYLLELAKRASELYKSSRSGLRNKILKTIFSNLKIYQKRVDFTLLEPFNSFFFETKSSPWLPGLDSNQQPRS